MGVRGGQVLWNGGERRGKCFGMGVRGGVSVTVGVRGGVSVYAVGG